MTQFHYKAIDKQGASVTGNIDAVDQRGAVAMLSDQGRFVTEMSEMSSQTHTSVLQTETKSISASSPSWTFGGGHVSSKDLVAMTSQFCTALRAGLPLMKCLELLRDQQKKPASRDMLDDLVQTVSSGQSLSDAMAAHPKVFSPLYVSMIRVGEAGGILEQTTLQLAQILKRDDKVRANMTSAMAYPAFVLCLGIVSVAIIVTWILPNVMSNMDVDAAMLPWPTQVLMASSTLSKGLLTTPYGWIGLGAVGGLIFWVARWIKREGRMQWDAFRLKIPILGHVLRSIAVGRFARTLGALTQGGVTILEALKVVRDTLGNEVLGAQIDHVSEEVKRGESLATPLDACGYFPPLLVQVVAVGEQTGTLDELLLNAAETFDEEADAAISRFMAVFPAALILIMGVVVGFIIIATLLPMVTLQLGSIG
ncbi:MAG: type II secretion system F family protein [Phycisphaerae bacterium]|nr:type II secretion system F family protein [Phycisphaerae bacterium]